MNERAKKRLLDALEACNSIASFARGKSAADYQRDEMLRSAVERKIEIIGEALTQASEIEPEIQDRVADLRRIVAMRNRIIHGYDTVDEEIVWDVITTKLSPLREQIAALLESES